MSLHHMVCWNCHHKWEDKPGQWGDHYKDGCPICGSLYWDDQDAKEEHCK